MYHLNPSVKQAAFITDSEGGILRCLRAMGACKAAIEWAEANDGLSFEELYNKCEKVDWLVWLACQANVECEKLFLLQEIQTSNHDFQTKSVEELAYFGTALAEASMDKLMSEKTAFIVRKVAQKAWRMWAGKKILSCKSGKEASVYVGTGTQISLETFRLHIPCSTLQKKFLTHALTLLH